MDDILLVVTGEFGRTPRINGGPGRDHWAPTNDIVFIGGGLKMGQVVGETDAKAAYVKSRPVTVQDYMATLLARAGRGPGRAVRRSQRPPAIDGRKRQADCGADVGFVPLDVL